MMGILTRLFGRETEQSKPLVGCWHLERAEGEPPVDPAEADFREDGTLHYAVLSGGRWHVMKLRYRLDGDELITDQPSAPREERTRFSLRPDGTLVLEFNGVSSVFRRGNKMAPDV